MRSLCYLGLWLSLGGVPLWANDTALHEGGAGPEPVGGIRGKESVIQMVSERLTIEFGREATQVTARFIFKNTKPNASAYQLVGFPDLGAAQVEAQRRTLVPYREGDLSGPLENVETYIQGRLLPSILRYGFVKPDQLGWQLGKGKGNLMAWHTVSVVFPPNEEVIIERRYRAPNGTNALGQKLFTYITHTGGIWQGRIQKLVAIVTLTDGLTTKDLQWRTTANATAGSYPPLASWEIISPNQLSLTWLNFEPRTEPAYGGFGIFTKPAN